jgi:hypothetical protein
MRKYLVAVTALAVAVTALMTAGVALGASSNTYTLDTKVNPPVASATVLGASGLFVETSTLAAGDPGTPTSPTLFPVPTTHVNLDLDHNVVINPAAVPVCSNALTGTTQAGMKACGDSYVGGGYATICASAGGPGSACGTGIGGASAGTVNAQVSAYNGPATGDPGGNKPTLKLQGVADHTVAGPLTTVLTGTLLNSPGVNEFGKRLSVDVPSLAGGLGAITDFSVNVNNGKFLRAKCNGDMVWNFQTVSTDGSGSATATNNNPCTN